MSESENNRGTSSVTLDGDMLRNLRVNAGYSQEKLAALSNVNRRTIQRAEAGMPIALESAAFIAEAVSTPIADLRVSSGTEKIAADRNAFSPSVRDQNEGHEMSTFTKIAIAALAYIAVDFLSAGYVYDQAETTIRKAYHQNSAILKESSFIDCSVNRVKYRLGFGMRAINMFNGAGDLPSASAINCIPKEIDFRDLRSWDTYSEKRIAYLVQFQAELKRRSDDLSEKLGIEEHERKLGL